MHHQLYLAAGPDDPQELGNRLLQRCVFHPELARYRVEPTIVEWQSGDFDVGLKLAAGTVPLPVAKSSTSAPATSRPAKVFQNTAMPRA